MPTFRQDNKLGDSVPLIKTPDIGDKQVTERKLADGSVTSSKLSTEIANMLSLLTTRISAFKVADNLSSLPTEENTIGWLVDNHLYVYVGNGSTPESGMYQDCGELRGPQGIQGEQGLSGLNGKSAYDIWTEQPGNEDKSEIDFLEFTRGSKGDKGDQGERGYDISNIEQIVKSTEDGGKNIISVTRSDGWSKVFEILNGSKGSKGDKGTSIVKLEQTRKTTESSGLNTIEATLGDGTKESFEIYNGAKGEQGDKGEKGDKGDQGEIGPQGNSGIADASNKTLVNDAITGGETDFLSAEVGKLGILTYDCSKGGSVTHATLQDAINSVPATFQKVGLTITYKSGNTIYRYTLKANSWSADPANWFSVEDKLSDLDDVAHQLEVSGIFVLKHYSYNYPDGIFTKNNSYDLIICKIEEGVLEVAFNTNARRHALYSDNPYNDQSSKYQVFDPEYNANDVITIPQTVKYVVFMVESNNNNSYYELSIKKNLYCGLSKNTFKKHLEEVSNIDHYDYRQDIIKGMLFRSVNASFYLKNTKGIVFVKIKNGSKFIRMFLKKAFEVHFFSDIPLYNDGKSNYISTYDSYDSGAEIPTNAKYCIFCFELNDVASMNEPLIIQQINEETNVDIMASSSVFEKYIDLTITEAAIQGAFNGGVYPEGVISKLRACSLCKIDDENTLLAFCLEVAKAICIASISNNGDVSQSFITWSNDGVGYAYPSLVRDKDGVIHLFFAAYMLDYTSSMTKHYISEDNGNTWSFANDIEYKLESDGYTRHFMCSSYQALLAKSGKLIVPVYYINSTVPASAAGILIYDTDTDSYMFHVFADQSDSVNEGSVAEIENNVFILSLRTQRNICRIAYLIDLNEESPYFKPYFDFAKNIVSKKNGEMMEYHNNLLALTKITKGNSNSAHERYDPSLFISCDNGKTFTEKIKIFEGQTVGESTVISDGNGYILCAAMHFDGYRLVKMKRVF